MLSCTTLRRAGISPHSVIAAAPCCTLTTAHTKLKTASTQLQERKRRSHTERVEQTAERTSEQKPPTGERDGEGRSTAETGKRRFAVRSTSPKQQRSSGSGSGSSSSGQQPTSSKQPTFKSPNKQKLAKHGAPACESSSSSTASEQHRGRSIAQREQQAGAGMNLIHTSNTNQ